MKDYYLLWPMADDLSIANQTWVERFLAANGYPCGHYNFSVRPEEIILASRGENVPYNGVAQLFALDYLRSDLIDALSPAIESLLTFGTLVDGSNGTIGNLRTIIGGPSVYLRGGSDSYCSRCEVCRQLIYNPMSRWHVLTSEVPDLPLFLTHTGGIVVCAELREKLSGRRWRKLSINRLPVHDTPEDGFPVNLNDIKHEQERRPAWERSR